MWPWAAGSIGAFLKCKERKDRLTNQEEEENGRASTAPILRHLEDEGTGEGPPMSLFQVVTFII